MSEMKDNDKYLLNSVYHALEIMDLLSRRENIGVAEISKELGLGKTSAFRLLYTLETKGYVVKNESAKYMLGRKFAQYGETVASRQDDYAITRPILEALRDLTGETVHLSVLLPNLNVMFAEKVMSNTFSFQMNSHRGYDMPAHISGSGKVLMSGLLDTDKEKEIRRIELKKHTKNTLTTYEQLMSELYKVKAQGYGVDNEESEEGLYCVAVPVFKSNGTYDIAISISGAASRISANQSWYIEELRKTAASISELLGL